MAHKLKPVWTISFDQYPDDPLVDTTELLEELDVSYNGLWSRIQRNGFPQPERSGHNGKSALWRKTEVYEWLEKHGFRTRKQ